MDLYDISREIKSALREDRRDLGGIVRRDKLALVIGLGWNIAKDLELSVKPEKIESVFPTVTVSVLATLLTAKRPSEHGILGWRLLDKKRGMIVNLMTREGPIPLETYLAGADSLAVIPVMASRFFAGQLRAVPYYTFWDGIYV